MRTKEIMERVYHLMDRYEEDKPKLIKELKKLIREGQRDGNMVLMGSSYCGLSGTCYDLNDMDGMLTNALKAVELLKDTDAYEMLVKSYVNIGYVYSNQENHQLSLEVDDKAYQILHTHRIKGDLQFTVANNLATNYHMLGDCKTAIKLLAESYGVISVDSKKSYLNKAMYTLNLSDCYIDDHNLEKGQEILKGMEEWLDQVDFQPIVCDYYLRSAIVSFLLGDQEAGNLNVEKSFELVPADCYPNQIYEDYKTLTGMLIKNGEFKKADKIFELMTAYAKENQCSCDQLIATQTFADYYHGMGEDKKALECYQKLESLYQQRMKELKEIQLKVYRNIKSANEEVKKLKRKMRENEAMLSLEPMTKLLNRTALLKISSEFIDTAVQKKQKVGAIFIDIDFFKECNDTYGHAAGDEIIRTVARACQKEEKANIRFARYGGDEFFGITRGLSDEEVAEVAAHILKRIREADIPNEKNPNGQRVTLSAGAVNVPVSCSGDTIIEIAKLADKAVYHAKNSGKNVIYLLEQKCGDHKGRNATYKKVDF